jgi:hypothetical protein
MMFYSNGNPAISGDQVVDSIFATFSLGNVGQNGELCFSQNLAKPYREWYNVNSNQAT